jgi:DNA-directed RNA polymerase subunit H
MHILQPKHIKLKKEEVDKLLSDMNISLTQLPKIKIIDPALPEGFEIGDVLKIERIEINEKGDKKINIYYRVVTI